MARCFLVLVLLPLASGCGTLSNLGRYTGVIILDGTPTERVYGGVWRDLTFAQDDIVGVPRPESRLGRANQLVGAAYCLLVDLPLSAVGDTLTLPLVLPYALKDGEVFPRRTRIEPIDVSQLSPPADAEAERPAAPVPGGARLPSSP
jgi:uncharacterized protein YceK